MPRLRNRAANFFLFFFCTTRASRKKTTKLTADDLSSAFLWTPRWQKGPAVVTKRQVFSSRLPRALQNVSKLLRSWRLRSCVRGEGGEKESRLDTRKSRPFPPARAAVGHSRDSCRLWHEEQELRAGCVKREEASPPPSSSSMRGEVRTAQNHRGASRVQNAHSVFLPLDLIGSHLSRVSLHASPV